MSIVALARRIAAGSAGPGSSVRVGVGKGGLDLLLGAQQVAGDAAVGRLDASGEVMERVMGRAGERIAQRVAAVVGSGRDRPADRCDARLVVVSEPPIVELARSRRRRSP